MIAYEVFYDYKMPKLFHRNEVTLKRLNNNEKANAGQIIIEIKNES